MHNMLACQEKRSQDIVVLAKRRRLKDMPSLADLSAWRPSIGFTGTWEICQTKPWFFRRLEPQG